MRPLPYALSSLALVFASFAAAGCGGGGNGDGTDTDTTLPGLYVDAVNGNDTSGDGSSAHPYKTIKKGLQRAGLGDTVRVRAGTYDAANGETFPIRPGFDVTIIGAEKHTAEGTLRLSAVVGGGFWSGDPDGRLHATIIPNDGNRIVGLRLVDPEPAVAFGTKPQAVLLAMSGATLESCSMSDSDRGVRLVNGVSHCLLKNCAMARNAIGIFVDSAGTDNRVEGCTVTDNNTGVMCFSGGVDFGSGPFASAGHNAFVASATNDFVHFTGTTETIFAGNCFWDHASPTVATGNPASLANADVWVLGGGGVTLTGAQVYVPPGTGATPPGGGVVSP